MPDTIRLVEPAFNQEELPAIAAALSGTADNAVPDVEQAVANCTRQHDAVAVASFEDAAVMLLMASGVGPGKEVVAGGLLDARLEAAVRRVGARLVYVDVDPVHLGPNVEALEHAMTASTRAVLAGPIDGNCTMVEAVAAACVRQEVAFIEIVGAWLGLQAGDRPLGARGRAAIVDLGGLSPYGVEHGGAVATSDNTLACACRALRTASGPAPCTLPPSMAVIAALRLARLDAINEACTSAAGTYVRALAGTAELTLPALQGPAWPRFVVRLDDALSEAERNEILDGMHRHDIEVCRTVETTTSAAETCPRAVAMAPRLLTLPLHAQLSNADASLVAQTLELMIQRATFQRD